MEREIKFRAWDRQSNRMFKSVAILGILEKFVTMFSRDCFHNSHEWGCQDDFAYDFELMQFTGLKDKNGKEIYEGDIVKWWDEYGDGRFVWFKEIVKYDGGAFYPLCIMPSDEFEVIGNVFENPELIKNS